MSTIALPESVVFDLVQAADKWLDELLEYIIPSAYESSDQDGDNYQAEADELQEAVNAARRALGIEIDGED